MKVSGINKIRLYWYWNANTWEFSIWYPNKDNNRYNKSKFKWILQLGPLEIRRYI